MDITDKISLGEAMPFFIVVLIIIILFIIVRLNRNKRGKVISSYPKEPLSTAFRDEIKKPDTYVGKGNPVSPIKPKDDGAGIR